MDFQQLAIKRHGSRYDYLTTDWSVASVRIVCRVHGPFIQNKYAHKNGSGCPKCAGNNKKTLEEFSTEQQRVHGNKYEYLEYSGARQNVRYICPVHGVRSQLQHNHLKGHGCSLCQCPNQVLYILDHQDGTYKIGVSNNPLRRAKEVGSSCVVLQSWQVEDQFQTEKYLHNLLKDYRITNLQVKSGGTEFFKLSKKLLQSTTSYLDKISV